jgi:hypothetical protein
MPEYRIVWTKKPGATSAVMKKLLGAMLILMWASSAFADRCLFADSALEIRPLASKGPTEVTLRLYVNDIISIHDVDQSFTSDVLFRAEWHDPRLAHGNKLPCRADLDQIWTPSLQLLNRRSVERIREPELSVFPDGSVLFLIRSFGDFSFRADLSNFPFDKQELSFNIVSTYSSDEVRVVAPPEMLGMSDQLSVANWKIELRGARNQSLYIAPVDRYLERTDLVLEATRLSGYYTWQQLLPLLLVVMMTWMVFWIPLEVIPSRVGLAATSMLTLIAYRFAMASVLPPIAYLTRLDIFMVGASVLVFAGLATTVAVSYIFNQYNEELASTVNRTARWLLPLLIVLLTVFAFYA